MLLVLLVCLFEVSFPSLFNNRRQHQESWDRQFHLCAIIIHGDTMQLVVYADDMFVILGLHCQKNLFIHLLTIVLTI